ncbi:glycosyltransferase family 1 protein [Bacteroides sp. An51A]|uniref:glycosyltransferase family 4 protein n=1 Tax=Bacteroides sp. An51A TaxID=1965640 RepID=UPI000B369EE8|nr:glycosyltransferase family 1 protein [Bacteroides sp. An51A]OUN77375.1 hypothetical protein B5G04_17755 [Bacteroides sp. An51A]
MKVLYIYRHPDMGFSIGRVFHSIEQEMRQYCEVKSLYLPMSNYKPISLWKNIHAVFDILKKEHFDIVHITGTEHYLLPFLKKFRVVLTIHDLVFIENVKNPVKKLYKWLFWLCLPIKFADEITCISNETRRKVLLQVNTNKIHVIYNPIDPAFVYTPKNFNKRKPVILHIGTLWNKNLIRSIESLKNISCHLRIIGQIEKEIKNLLDKYKIDYSNVCNLSDEEIRQEYINCDIVNFPSIYEGFGMPIIEGQQTGRIVITSSIQPLKEISGGAVFFVNPFDEQSINSAYIEAIENDKLRNTIIQQGLENVKRFHLKNIVQQYLNIYNMIKV